MNLARMGLKGRKSPTLSALSQMIRAKPAIPTRRADQLGLRGSIRLARMNLARMGLKWRKSPTLSALSQMIRAKPAIPPPR